MKGDVCQLNDQSPSQTWQRQFDRFHAPFPTLKEWSFPPPTTTATPSVTSNLSRARDKPIPIAYSEQLPPSSCIGNAAAPTST